MMPGGSLKRPSPESGDNAPPAKRSRNASFNSTFSVGGDRPIPNLTQIELPSAHYQSKVGLERSIGLALQHVGFGAAHPDALESFALAVEQHLTRFIGEIKRLSLNARREHPTAADYEQTLRRFNVPISSLKPHLRHPIPKNDLLVEYFDPVASQDAPLVPLPTLSEELSSRPEKEAKPYIPKAFPEFPSTHTYKYTPKADRESRDPTKVREEAAKSAKQGEDALRGFLVAAKSQQQKKVRSSAERDKKRKERHGLWEAAMQQLLPSNERGKQLTQLEIADHSMIVNAELPYQRREISRAGKNIPGAGEMATSKG